MRPEIRERIEQIRRGEVPEGYKRTKVGVIPEDWKVKKIKEFSRTSSGSTPDRKKVEYYYHGSINWFKTGELGAKYLYVSEEKVTKQALKETSIKLFPENTLLIAMYGATIGKMSILMTPSTTNQACCAILPNENFDNEYVYYQLSCLKDQLISKGAGAAQPNISQEIIQNFYIPFPQLDEQREISKVLSEWDKAIELKEKLIEQKKLQKKGLMHLLLTGKVRWSEIDRIDLKKGLDELEQGLIPQGYKNSKIGIIPNDWNVLKLRNIVQRIHRKNDGEDYPVLTISSLSGFLDQSERFSKVIAGENLSKYILLERGEFAYNKGNSKTYPYGCIYRLDSHEKALVPNVYYCFRVIYGDSEYYKQYFLAGALNRQLARVINTGVRNDGLLNIDAEDFFDCLIHVPPLEEQKKIAMVLSTADREIHLLEQELEALKQQKKGLMQLLLTGIVRVHELEQVECLTLCSS